LIAFGIDSTLNAMSTSNLLKGGAPSNTHVRHFVVAVDGSRLSKRAFDASLALMNAADDEHDKLHVVHVAASEPKSLMDEYTEHCRHAAMIYDGSSPTRLETTVEFAKLGVDENSSSAKDKLVETIVHTAGKDAASFLVLGSYGGRIESTVASPRQSTSSTHALGSVAVAALSKSHCTTVLVKMNGQPPAPVEQVHSTALNFVVAVDGSAASRLAFEVAKVLANRSKRHDTITVVHLAAQQSAAADQLLRSFEGADSYVLRIRDRTNSVGADICGYLSTQETVDYLVIGSEVLMSKEFHLGSVCEYCAIHANCHVVVAKPTHGGI
jgi:nucleotide-binding universal stress UspA family protein